MREGHFAAPHRRGASGIQPRQRVLRPSETSAATSPTGFLFALLMRVEEYEPGAVEPGVYTPPPTKA
jgi:hypothetical protein